MCGPFLVTAGINMWSKDCIVWFIFCIFDKIKQLTYDGYYCHNLSLCCCCGSGAWIYLLYCHDYPAIHCLLQRKIAWGAIVVDFLGCHTQWRLTILFPRTETSHFSQVWDSFAYNRSSPAPPIGCNKGRNQISIRGERKRISFLSPQFDFIIRVTPEFSLIRDSYCNSNIIMDVNRFKIVELNLRKYGRLSDKAEDVEKISDD